MVREGRFVKHVMSELYLLFLCKIDPKISKSQINIIIILILCPLFLTFNVIYKIEQGVSLTLRVVMELKPYFEDHDTDLLDKRRCSVCDDLTFRVYFLIFSGFYLSTFSFIFLIVHLVTIGSRLPKLWQIYSYALLQNL